MSRAYFRSSQGIGYSPRDGHFLNQYERTTRVWLMHGIIMPKALRAFRDIPNCQGRLRYAENIYTTLSKFLIIYNFRDPGESYTWGPNYIVDLYMGVMDALADCAPPSALEPALQDVVRTDWFVPARGPTVSGRFHEGEYDPGRRMLPLTEQQCQAVEAVRAKHLNVDKLVPLARDPWEATMLDMVFATDSDIVPGDPYCTPERAARMVAKTSDRISRWIAALGCVNGHATGIQPDRVAVALFMWSHFRAHALLAACMPDMVFVEPTMVEWADLYPKCMPGPNFDVHYCAYLVE